MTKDFVEIGVGLSFVKENSFEEEESFGDVKKSLQPVTKKLKTNFVLKLVYDKNVSVLNKKIDNLSNTVQKLSSKIKRRGKKNTEVELDCSKKEQSKGLTAARQKS